MEYRRSQVRAMDNDHWETLKDKRVHKAGRMAKRWVKKLLIHRERRPAKMELRAQGDGGSAI